MRLIIISNRLPFTIREICGKLTFERSVGGLATGIESYLASPLNSFSNNYIWVGWPGISTSSSVLSKTPIPYPNTYPISLNNDELSYYYNGFCNSTIWPLYHNFTNYASYNENYWDYYKKVNQKYLFKLSEILKKDDLVWIHDYHLMLLPKLIKERFSNVSVGFFLHIPFPKPKVFEKLPKKWRTEILQGMISSDLLGFHIPSYGNNFLYNYTNHFPDANIFNLFKKIKAYPMGVASRKFLNQAKAITRSEELLQLKRRYENKKIILSVDRLDYTKGIIKRLQALELFLKVYPQWRNKVVLILVLAPSRTEVTQYQNTKFEIEKLVKKINSNFGSLTWQPIDYQYKSIGFKELVILYNISSVGLITPLIDGMNLVSKEFVTAKADNRGALVLSKNAGSATELKDALIVDPRNKFKIAKALKIALEMPLSEQVHRNMKMQEYLLENDVSKWANNFIKELQNIGARENTKENQVTYESLPVSLYK